MMRMWLLSFCCLLNAIFITDASAARLVGFRVLQQTNNNTTRVVFDLDEKTTYHYFGLTSPERLVVDLSNTTTLVHVSQAQALTPLIKQIRTAKKEDAGYRIVFDLSQNVSLKSFEATPDAPVKERLIFDLSGPSIKKTKPIIQPVVATPSQPILTSQPTIALRPVVVVIDPGHGGKDPGAVGPQGMTEKDVVLAISKELAKELSKQPGIRVYLTRESDSYITLRQRLRIARRDNADIFIAIHADAYRKAASQGASVYALSLRGASSEAARWLAAAENYSELGGASLKDKDDVLRSVLINLSQTATITASLQLGHSLLTQLNTFTPLHHDSVEQAPFVVLKSPDIPSVLIETGFLSNPREEHLLSSKTYQHQLARGIVQGVYTYFYQRPPPGTFIASQVTNNKKGKTA